MFRFAIRDLLWLTVLQQEIHALRGGERQGIGVVQGAWR